MKLFYLEQNEDLSRLSFSGREDRLNKLFAELFHQNQIVQEVVIDGLTFRENYEPVLLQRLMEIREVRVHTVQGDIVAQEIIAELKDYIPKVLQAADSISDLFYGEMTSEGWGYFSQLLEGIHWIKQSVYIILDQFNRFPGTDPLEQLLKASSERLNSILKELENCLERSDLVAVGDLIKYEFSELFRELDIVIKSRVIL